MEQTSYLTLQLLLQIMVEHCTWHYLGIVLDRQLTQQLSNIYAVTRQISSAQLQQKAGLPVTTSSPRYPSPAMPTHSVTLLHL